MATALSPPYMTLGSLTCCIFLLATFHINNVILFYLAAALPEAPASSSKSPDGVRQNTKTSTNKHITSLIMLPALIEGTESFVFFTIMLLFPQRFQLIGWIMTIAVFINIIQRMLLAKEQFHLNHVYKNSWRFLSINIMHCKRIKYQLESIPANFDANAFSNCERLPANESSSPLSKILLNRVVSLLGVDNMTQGADIFSVFIYCRI